MPNSACSVISTSHIVQFDTLEPLINTYYNARGNKGVEMRSIILNVAKKRCRGGNDNRKGQRIRYLGEKSHWTVYYLDENGYFHAERISAAMIPVLRARKQRFLVYQCPDCHTRFRSNKRKCPSCGCEETVRKKRL